MITNPESPRDPFRSTTLPLRKACRLVVSVDGRGAANQHSRPPASTDWQGIYDRFHEPIGQKATISVVG
eukprot:3059267-Pyramimonas_sp.AAC.1